MVRRIPALCALLLVLLLPAPLRAQFDQGFTKRLLEEFSLQLFGENASGFMGPLVIVSNVGANHGFYHSAHVEKTDRLSFEFSVQTVYTWVRDDQRNYTGHIPYAVRPTDSDTLKAFKSLVLEPAVRDGKMSPTLTTATVFGGTGSWFRIPKEYLWFVPPDQLKLLPDSLQLTNGTNQSTVFAAIPQLRIGTFASTDMLLRYIPPVTFDKNIGKFSFFGVALRHSISNTLTNPRLGGLESFPVDLAVLVSYEHSTIENTVGTTRAKLDAATDMLSANIHASRRFDWIEPFAGISIEYLSSSGTYTFTLPQTIKDQIGYDIDPQRASISLDDLTVKGTLGVAALFGPVDVFLSAGLSKHVIFGGGAAYHF
ncbi:MAG: hypothetical protein HY962_08610 [Ignavibacteriae bacterium]|nr:hypothetical protein [Ignavibacteriota bacterium]